MIKHKLAFAEGSGEEVLLEWDRDNPNKKRVAWKITKGEDICYAIIEYIYCPVILEINKQK